MAYFAPYINETGFHIPTYADIEGYLVALAQSCWGVDIYLDSTTDDFKWIAGVSKIINDTNQGALMAYNARSPVNAVGVGLDSIVSLNGLKRNAPTNSLATLTIGGTPFTVINNGIAADVSGNKWDLPSTVVIGSGGTVTVTATCETPGAISATAGQISIIYTPTLGWTSVVNPGAAIVGQPLEKDSALRARQGVSVAAPSQTIVDGIKGAVSDLPTVLTCQVYENDTTGLLTSIGGANNPGGFPPKSITVVVDGGDGQSIADAIAIRKTPGCYSNGDQIYNYTDPFGVNNTIRFYRPINETIVVTLTIHALNGYTNTIGASAKQAIANYINTLAAGQSCILSQLEYAAVSINTNPQNPYFSVVSVLAAISPNVPGTADINLNFNQKAVTAIDASNITLVVV